MALVLDSDFRSLALPSGPDAVARRSPDTGNGEEFANSLKLARGDTPETEQAIVQGVPAGVPAVALPQPAPASFLAAPSAASLEANAVGEAGWVRVPGEAQADLPPADPVVPVGMIAPEVTELATDREIIRVAVEAAKFGIAIPDDAALQNTPQPSPAAQDTPVPGATLKSASLPAVQETALPVLQDTALPALQDTSLPRLPGGAPPDDARQMPAASLTAQPTGPVLELPEPEAAQPGSAEAPKASNLAASAPPAMDRAAKDTTNETPAQPAANAAKDAAPAVQRVEKVEPVRSDAAEPEPTASAEAEPSDSIAFASAPQPELPPQDVAQHAAAAPAQWVAAAIIVPSPATPVIVPAQATRQTVQTVTAGATAKADLAALRGPQNKIPVPTDTVLPEAIPAAFSSAMEIGQLEDGSGLGTSGTGVIAMAPSVTQAPQQAALPTAPVPMAPAQAILIASPADVVDIVSKTAEDGQSDRVVVQLDPPELGRVSIDFKFDAQGLQHVTITSETPEAMRQLRQMHSELVQALERQGIGSQNMTFEHQQQDAQRAPVPNPFIRPGITGDTAKPIADAAAATNPPSPGRTLPGGRLDIRL